MGPETRQSQSIDAESAITHIRSSLLILAQAGERTDLDSARASLYVMREQAEIDQRQHLSAALRECESALEIVIDQDPASPGSIYEVLDKVAQVEAALLDSSLHSEDFLIDLESLVDTTFDDARATETSTDVARDRPELFDIDEETLDIFRAEAADLLTSIEDNLRVLVDSPDNSQEVWEIRRCAHTFKGAAGIVGYKDACGIAHKMEDLLDSVVASKRSAGAPVVDFLRTAVDALHSIIDNGFSQRDEGLFDRQYLAAVSWFKKEPMSEAGPPGPQTVHEGSSPSANSVSNGESVTGSPVIRVPADRIDELMELSRKLTVLNEAITKRFRSTATEIDEARSRKHLAALLEAGRELNTALDHGLQRIRMVRFATIQTRLSRAVNNTCHDQNKKAALVLENGDVEIDTIMIDALVEPLIHLLKNAIVHGIEAPDKRRLIGKPEEGRVTVRIEADHEALILSVADDGSGISIIDLKEKAVVQGMVTRNESDAMTDRDAMRLIFQTGLTTAEKVDLNAGRGVGMAIVKECIEDRGGSVIVESRPQTGTTFTLLLPLTPNPGNRASRAPEKQTADTIDLPPPLILIVDDSATIRNQAVKIVENAGFRTITANNGAEALELLLSGKWEPDLIFSDVEMPHIDGWQFLDYVKTDEHFGSIPVVMITSLDQPECRKRAFELGASDYIVKPVNSFDLERVCRQHALQP